MDDVIPPDMIEALPAKAVLRLLRDSVGLSIAEVARAAGLEKQGYYYYETRYKGRYLPAHVAPAIVRALVDAGASRTMAARLEPPSAAAPRPRLAASLDEIAELLREIRDLLRARA